MRSDCCLGFLQGLKQVVGNVITCYFQTDIKSYTAILLPQIALVLIDEVHLLSEGRGSCLEAGVVSRIKLVACKPEMAGVGCT